ncbi:MAG: substrate-binding domain-containing protein [Silicimonas sp.]|nr:substrate-binding domain-containing protein [Silicimonas sp.]NND17305.1 LacI family DNA-binding transcriptional regulator [Silicimonas sp.]
MNLKELANTLGLSPTTVSRALNGYPEVSESTRTKVFEAAAKHQYIPNSGARRLATGRTMSIGHVLPVSTKHEMVNPIFADFIAAAGDVYSRSGYDLMLSVVNDTDEAEFYGELSTRGTIDGLVVHGPKINDRRIELLNELKIPFIVHGRSTQVDADYSWLDINNRRAFFRATNFLLDLGHRSIALINGLADMDFAHRRYLGYKTALEDRGIAFDAALVSHDEMTETYGYNTARHLLASSDCPSAMLVSSIIPAIGVRRAISDAGLRMGHDISVVIHDDDLSYLRNGGDVPIFTGTRSSVREAGRRLAGMLIDAINTPGHPPRQTLLEAELMVGQSTGPAPALRRVLEQG